VHDFDLAFEPFGLSRTAFQPHYATIAESPKDQIEFLSNPTESQLKRLLDG
jgi:hypothetical protein